MNVACEQALHLGDIVKSIRARGTREETRLREAEAGKRKAFAGPSRLRRSLARSRAARFARPNRRACSQAKMNVAWFSLMWRPHVSTKTKGAEDCKEFLLTEPTKRS